MHWRSLWAQLSAHRRVKTPTIIQMEAVECGAAALAIILGYHRKFVPLDELREACGVTKDGSSAGDLLDAAETYGLASAGYECSFEDLAQLPLPFIVFWNYNHFLVVEGVNSDQVFLNDPASGPRSITHEEFKKGFSRFALTFEKTEAFQPSGHDRTLWSVIQERIVESRTPLLFIALVGILLLVPKVATPFLVQVFYDDILGKGQLPWLNSFLWVLGGLVVLAGCLTWLQESQLLRLYLKLTLNSNARLIWRLLRLPILFFTQRSSGEVAYRFQLNFDVMQALEHLPITAVQFCLMMVYVLLLWHYNSSIGMLAVSTGLLSMAVLHFMTRSRLDAYARAQQYLVKSMSFAVSSIQSIESIKAAGTENDVFARWAGYETSRMNAENAIAQKEEVMATLPNVIQGISFGVLLGIGSWAILQGELSVGILIAAQMLFTAFLAPINEFIQLSSTIQTLKVNAARIDDALKTKEDPIFALQQEVAQGSNQELFSGFLDVRELSFGYTHLAKPTIEGVSFQLKPGVCVVVVGPSGSGKSTLLKIIAGLYAPWSGEILLDGKVRSAIPQRQLHQALRFVDQNSFFFEGSVKENLTMWEMTLPEERLIAAAKDACIHEEIIARPLGYESLMREGGINFSGGQRQRLEIARALVSNPMLLLLDNATSALDAHTEETVMQNLQRRGCSIVMVAQRISTVEFADQILVLDGGRVVQRGKHQKLREEPGFYRQLVEQESFLEQGGS